MVSRIYVEKKPGMRTEAQHVADELRTVVSIESLRDVRIINRYDVEGADEELFERCIPLVFSEPQVDTATRELPLEQVKVDEAGHITRIPVDIELLAVEYLPGQFDQRADSASECMQLVSAGIRPDVRTAKLYVLVGALSAQDKAAARRALINPIEAREASLALPDTLELTTQTPQAVEVLCGFCHLNDDGLTRLINERGLAMDIADLVFCQHYFEHEHRDPTITELRLIDTYWSDHCRHTTFGTHLSHMCIDDETVQAAYNRYLELRRDLGRTDKPVCLMDMATIAAKWLVHTGALTGLDESEEINACTVKVPVDVDGTDEDWLFLFKNETHNHPTEIEPFGGAATCIGGAIRDPLSGRSYVYQAMRITGAADPRTPVAQTRTGKLPQRTIATTAAQGYASYGNQIGLATGQISELYHPGYAAKHMEVGAVVGATPASHVRRECPAPGDKIVLLGGKTGRDGIGGATGSSKTQTTESLETCGAEVQKGNAPVERKLQRLFRREDACRLIKRCNDFGAGGVSVAVGELADGLDIDLDQVPKKYAGLDGTELAISESQERMAVALAPGDVDEFLRYAHEENLEASVIATVCAEPRIRMTWRGDTIVDIAREFLASNGAPKHHDVHVVRQDRWEPSWTGNTFPERMQALVSDINVASSQGLAERFDATIGAASVLMPYGGRQQVTPPMAMVATFPVDGHTTTTSGMAWGFNPYLSEKNQFAGAYLAVVESVSKLVTAGFDHTRIYLSFQEYFERLRDDAARWGKPTAALLGALMAQLDLEVGAIGGKDSMSGSFENANGELDVPPTLISFAVATGTTQHAISPEFKGAGHRIICIDPCEYEDDYRPRPAGLLAAFRLVEELVAHHDALALSTPGYGGDAEALFKMCLGNRVGLQLTDEIPVDSLFTPAYGSFLIELSDTAKLPSQTCDDTVTVSIIGQTTKEYTFTTSEGSLDLEHLQHEWERPLSSIYPSCATSSSDTSEVASITWARRDHPDISPWTHHFGMAQPRVIIPVFPGTNCEYDTAHACERAGAIPDTVVINTLTSHDVAESVHEVARRISASQMIVLPGGFSGGDEPDGSAKFIAAFFRAPEVTEAVRDLLHERDGLILGICNGFQALIKLGLVPYGDIVDATESAPTLTSNTIGRHQSRLVHTRVASDLSPWLSACTPGDIYTVPISHSEGRFVAQPEHLKHLIAAGQIATQYVDENGVPRMDLSVNPNGSLACVEGLTSPDGRVLGKMGHSERCGDDLYANIPLCTRMPLFEGGVVYFS